jgi:hypothetical protein
LTFAYEEPKVNPPYMPLDMIPLEFDKPLGDNPRKIEPEEAETPTSPW